MAGEFSSEEKKVTKERAEIFPSVDSDLSTTTVIRKSFAGREVKFPIYDCL